MAERTGPITDKWPVPPATMMERLRHTLDVWDDYPEDFIVLIATSETYGPHVRTGLTIGDLRTLYGREKLGADTVVYGSAADRLRDRLFDDIEKHGPPPGDPDQP